jgi:hypothetical protein
MEFRSKANNHAFLLMALLPCPKFLLLRSKLKKFAGVPEAWAKHAAIDKSCHSLKVASHIGCSLVNPQGVAYHAFTPAVIHIQDTPEALMSAAVAFGNSPATTATTKEFGNAVANPPRAGEATLKLIRELNQRVDPWHLATYLKEAKSLRLSGVHEPYWRDWAYTDPAFFLVPEPLHHWDKMFFDHDLKWCINIFGAERIDYIYSLMVWKTGRTLFTGGISTLKQLTGRAYRAIQSYIIAAIAGF